MYADMWIFLSLLLVPASTLPSPGTSDPKLSAWYLANEYYPPGVQRPSGYYGPHEGNDGDGTWRGIVDNDKERPEPDPDLEEYGTTHPSPGYTDAYYSGRDWENEYDEYDDGNGDEYDDYDGNADAFNTRRLPEDAHRLQEERPQSFHDEENPRIGSLGMNGPFPWLPTDTHLRRAKRNTGHDIPNEIGSFNEIESEGNSNDKNLITVPGTNNLNFEPQIGSDGTKSDKIPTGLRKKRGFYSEALQRHTARKNAWKNKVGVFGFVNKKEDLTKLRRTKRDLLSREMDATSYRGSMNNDENNYHRNFEVDEAQDSPLNEEYDVFHPLPIPPPGTDRKVWRFENEFDPFSMESEYDYEEDSNDDDINDYPIQLSDIASDNGYNQHSIDQDSSEMRNRAFGELDGQTDMSSEMQTKTNPVDEDDSTSPGFVQDYEPYPRDDASSMEEATNFSYEQMDTASMPRPTPRMHRRINPRFRRQINHKTARGYVSSSEEIRGGNAQSFYVDPPSVSRGYVNDNFRFKRSLHSIPFHRHRDQRVSYPVGQVGIFGVERRREDLSAIRRA